MSTLRRAYRRDSSGKNEAAEYVLEANSNREEVNISPNVKLWFEPFWRVDEDGESACLGTSLEIGISSKRRLEVRELVVVAKSVRRLLSILYQRDIVGQECHVRLDHPSHESRRFLLWHGRLNVPLSNAADLSRQDARPFVRLADLGGLDAFARWVRLSRNYPRLVSPIISAWEIGRKPAAIEIAELATAMEYCVSLARKRNKKAAWTQGVKNHVHAVAKTVGAPFDRWCGDTEEWSLLMWTVYNDLKHNHSDRDPREVAIMAASARVLLTAYLLMRISKNRVAVERFLGDYRWENIRTLTLEVVASSNLKNLSRNSRRKLKRGQS